MDVVNDLISAGRRFDERGWVLGTSGNFSAVLSREPLRIVITRSGAHKGALTAEDFVELDAAGSVVGGDGRPSAEAPLHFLLVAARGAGAVLHTHSIWSTFLSDRLPGGFEMTGYEMLKGLERVVTHEHREWMPVIENDQDMARLSAEVRRVLDERPRCHGFLLHRHGLYTWGTTMRDAVRHVEILEFLLESIGRARFSPPVPEEGRWHS